MVHTKKYAVVLVAVAAIGLFWALTALTRPVLGDPPPDNAAAQPQPTPPANDGAAQPPKPSDKPGAAPGGSRPSDSSKGAPQPNGRRDPGPPGGMPPGMGPRGGGMPMQGPGGPPMDPFSGPVRPGMPGMAFGPMNMGDPEMLKLQQKDMELEQQARQLAIQYQSPETSKADREKIKQKVIDAVNKQFEIRQQRRALELKRLEDELKRLREIVERRAKAKKELVERRVSELVGPDEPGVEF
jgi:hypothetical protein